MIVLIKSPYSTVDCWRGAMNQLALDSEIGGCRAQVSKQELAITKGGICHVIRMAADPRKMVEDIPQTVHSRI